MVDEVLRQELTAMRAEDLRVRDELLQSGELGEGYAPRMEAVHRRNALRLQQIIAERGWPDRELAGTDGTLALPSMRLVNPISNGRPWPWFKKK
jgi:hypothetical protein